MQKTVFFDTTNTDISGATPKKKNFARKDAQTLHGQRTVFYGHMKDAAEAKNSILNKFETNTQNTTDNSLAYVAPENTPPKESYGFFDVIDIINPLQHVPLVNTAYRELTGDEIKGPSKIIGGGLYGGGIGALVGTADMVVEGTTGDDIQGNTFSFLGFKNDKNVSSTSQSASAYLNAFSEEITSIENDAHRYTLQFSHEQYQRRMNG